MASDIHYFRVVDEAQDNATDIFVNTNKEELKRKRDEVEMDLSNESGIDIQPINTYTSGIKIFQSMSFIE